MNDNNDLLSGVKDLKDAFDGLTPAFNEMMGSLKGINKEFAELQGALNQVVNLFKKLGQPGQEGRGPQSLFVGRVGKGWKAAQYSKFQPEPFIYQPKGDWAQRVRNGLDASFDTLKHNFQVFRVHRLLGLHQNNRQQFMSDLMGNVRGVGRFAAQNTKNAFSYAGQGLAHLGGQFGGWAGRNLKNSLSVMSENAANLWDAPGLKLKVFAGALSLAVAGALMFTKKMRELSTGMFTSGASLGQVGRLSGMAGALGMSPAELGGRARSFGDLLTGGGVPGGLAAMIGINPYGGLGGDQNFFGKFQKALEYITNPNVDFNKASIMSRQFGMEDMMYLRFASPEMRRQALGATGMGSVEEMRKAADAQIQFNMTLKELTSTLMKLGQAVLPTLTLAMKNFGMVLSTSLAGGLIGLLLGGPAGGMIGMGIGAAGGLGLAAVMNNNTRATEIQTQAMEKNTATLNQFMKEGVYGGGERMRTAIPAAWGYSILEERALGIGRSLGAFTI